MPKQVKVGAVIQARMGSSRLPGKVLMPLPYPNGTPLLLRILQALKQSKRIDAVIVATSENHVNNTLVEAIKHEKASVFRGAENDVLQRFADTVRLHNLDVVVRLTADNPFLDVPMLDSLLERHLSGSWAYTRSEGLPNGLTFEIITAQSLLEAAEAPDRTPADREHVTPYIIRHPNRFLQQRVVLNEDEAFSKLRLTVDYPADLGLASLICAALPTASITVADLKALFAQDPWLFEANQGFFQKIPHHSPQEELRTAIGVLQTLDMPYAARLLDRQFSELE